MPLFILLKTPQPDSQAAPKVPQRSSPTHPTQAFNPKLPSGSVASPIPSP